MKKIKILITLFVLLGFLFPLGVMAEGTGDPNADPNQLPEVVQEGGITTEESQQIQEEAQDNADTTSKDDTQSFITGAAVGASLGLIVGGVFAWLLKDRIL